MTILKWVLIVFGVLFLAVAAILFGGYFWASSIESAKMTASDLEVGGSYTDDERQELYDACKAKRSDAGDAETVCKCIADRAGTDISHYGRLVLMAGFEGSATKIVALTKGLMELELPAERVEDFQTESSQRVQNLLSSCGLTK